MSLKLQRGPVRAAFTKALEALNDELQKDEVDVGAVDVLFKRLQSRREKLSEIDIKVEKAMLATQGITEAAFEEEYKVVVGYVDQFTDMEAVVLSYLKPKEDSETTNQGDQGMGNQQKYRLPKLEWKRFGGDPKEWLGFWSQFRSIHEDDRMAPQDKFQYLIQATEEKSKARTVVESFPPSAENYPKVIDYLQKRFGKEDVLVEVYTRELLRLVLDRNNQKRVSIATLYDQLETQLRALESLGVKTDNNIAILYPMVESALPEETLRAWERKRSSTEDDDAKSRLGRLLEFLRAEVESEVRIGLAKTGFTDKKEPQTKTSKGSKDKSPPTAMDLLNQDDGFRKSGCIFCSKGGHPSSECFMARSMSLEEKNNLLKMKKACYYCLQKGHFSKTCRLKPRCHLCDKQHHTVMCPTSPRNQGGGGQASGGAVGTAGPSGIAGASGQMSLANHCSSGVLLQTLEIVLCGDKCTASVRALVDTGSQHSYVSKKAVDVIGLKKIGLQRMTHMLFGGQQTKEKFHQKFNLKMSKLDGTYSRIVSVLDQDVICGPVSSVPDGPWINELKEAGIQLTDTGKTHREIHILIGADIAGQLFTGRMYQTESGPVAMETVLGWTLMGKCHPDQDATFGSAMLVTSLHTHTWDVQDLWRLDVLGITDPVETKSKEELTKEAQQHFNETVKVNEEGRYEVSLPWIEGHPPVSKNRDVAEARLKTSIRKLQLKGKVQDYQKIFNEWEALGIIEKIQDDREEKKSYLPHHPVFKDLSTTTPIRPVFDASAKKGGFPSLNDCLEKGPNLIELLPEILIRFRQKRYGIVSDIKKAFLQISVKKEDRNYLRFLWLENGQVTEYRHCRVVFGVSASPFLLAATLNHHLDHCDENDRVVAELLRKSLYVDNSVLSLDTEEELIEFMEKSTRILLNSKMELRGWEWSRSVKCLKEDGQAVVPVLGMLWDTEKDTIKMDMRSYAEEIVSMSRVETSGADSLTSRECGLEVGRVDEEKGVTKRLILSAAQKVFDPLGVTCPVTLVPKIQLQELWKSKLSWDATVSEEVSRGFLKWKKDLLILQRLEIPRWVIGISEAKLTLHTFTDASKAAYSACVFLRVESDSGVQVQLVLAKARVASTKKMSIPRLELLGCGIGARLADTVRKNLGYPDITSVYWTDSCNALYWIQRSENWATFVWNRVQEIRRLTDPNEWRHVSGELNPADLPSRGCSATHLIESRWWEGPKWLYLSEDDWPRSSVQHDLEVVMAEKKKTVVSQLATESSTPWYLRRFSSFRKVVRLIGRILLWRKICNERKLSQEQEEVAELYLLRMVQKESFEENDPILKQLNVRKDDFGMLRVQTKIIMREDYQDFRFPILLPSQHPVVKLLLIQEHEKRSHCGTQVLLCTLRERFWILKSRRLVREVIHGCLRCRREKVKRVETVEAPLPVDRVRDAAVFEVTGVDLGGPLYLKSKEKVWFAVFTCAVYRAVHLEVVSSLSTEGFMMALRRFIARRGRPSTIRSDHGTNFEGTNNAMNKLDWKKIEEEAAEQRIRWVFNPPSAPWWGGWWERIVGVVKCLLRRILGRASLTYEELETVLCDVEAVCNDRPLTYVSEDPDDLIQLTPSMFLRDLKTCGVPDLDNIDETALNRRLKYRQQLRRDVRERFRTEYLGMLVHNHHTKKTRTIRVNDVVLIGDDNRKRMDWRLGRVLELYPGRDSVERVAKLKTAFGEVTRPVQRLYPMEVQQEDLLVTSLDSADEEKTDVKKTRSGRVVKIPSRFME